MAGSTEKSEVTYAGAAIADEETGRRVSDGLRQYGLRGTIILNNPCSGRFSPLRTAVVTGVDETGARLSLKLYEDSDGGRAKLRVQVQYLQALRGRVAAPEVVGCEETAERFGRPALVTSHLGEPFDCAIDSLAREERRRVVEDLADAMATLAGLSLAELGLPSIGPLKIGEMTLGSFAWSTDWYSTHLPEDNVRRELALHGIELLRGAELPSRPARLCHQDLAMCNVMVQGRRFSGLVDWDYAEPAAAERDLGSAVGGLLTTLLVPQSERLRLLSALLIRYSVQAGAKQLAEGWRLALLFALDSLLDWMNEDKNAPRKDLVWATSLAVEGLCGRGALSSPPATENTS